MPRDVDLAPTTINALSEADAAVGQLHGLGRLVRAPALLMGPYIRREAVASSRLEGTEASLSDLLQAEAAGGSRADDDVAEVERYVAATYRGLELVRALPLSSAVVRDQTQRALGKLAGVRRELWPVFVLPSALRLLGLGEYVGEQRQRLSEIGGGWCEDAVSAELVGDLSDTLTSPVAVAVVGRAGEVLRGEADRGTGGRGA